MYRFTSRAMRTRYVGIQGPLLLAVLAAIGCEQAAVERVPAAGKVFIDGQPLTEGIIRFVPNLGRPASSAILPDGSFELASDSVDRASALGVPPGTYRVQVTASTVVDEETVVWKAPAMYADFRTSGLNVTIDKPTRDLLIELTWGDNKPAEAESPTADDDAPSSPNLADASSTAATADKESKP